MKKTIIALALAVSTVAALAQGTVNFDNSFVTTQNQVDAKIYLNTVGGTPLAGATYSAQLYFGTSAGSLTAVGPISSFYASGTGGEGYISSPAFVALPGIAPGTAAFVQIRAWANAASYEAATVRGVSNILNPTTGGAGSPPSLAANLVGLQSFAIVPVPEPSTIALGILGAGSLLFLRRKK